MLLDGYCTCGVDKPLQAACIVCCRSYCSSASRMECTPFHRRNGRLSRWRRRTWYSTCWCAIHTSVTLRTKCLLILGFTCRIPCRVHSFPLHMYSAGVYLLVVEYLLLPFLLFFRLIRVPTVRESQGILSESGKVGENRGSGKSQGILKYHSLDQLFMHYFTILPASGGFAPSPKHCRLVYIAIFYNGTKLSITFVYLVLFYWCRE